MMKKDVLKWAQETYGTKPESLWAKYPEYLVLRQENNQKWYAIFMTVKRSVLGLDGEGDIDIVDVKCEPLEIDFLTQQKGFLHGYHMNKNHWLTILLDGSVELKTVCSLLERSFEMTAPKIKKSKKTEENHEDNR